MTPKKKQFKPFNHTDGKMRWEVNNHITLSLPLHKLWYFLNSTRSNIQSFHPKFIILTPILLRIQLKKKNNSVAVRMMVCDKNKKQKNIQIMYFKMQTV